MRASGVLTLALVLSCLTSCGEQGAGSTLRDRSGVAGHVLLGPQCPVEMVDDPCQDDPATGVKVTVAMQRPAHADAAGDVVARTTTGDDGNFRVAVPPGNYVVTADAGMSCELMRAHVSVRTYSKVDIACDTGIR